MRRGMRPLAPPGAQARAAHAAQRAPSPPKSSPRLGRVAGASGWRARRLCWRWEGAAWFGVETVVVRRTWVRAAELGALLRAARQ